MTSKKDRVIFLAAMVIFALLLLQACSSTDKSPVQQESKPAAQEDGMKETERPEQPEADTETAATAAAETESEPAAAALPSVAPDPDEESRIRQELHNLETVELPLTDAEANEIQIQSGILQALEIPELQPQTADLLAEYYVRCQRLEQAEEPVSILTARYENTSGPFSENGWEYWIVTSSSGVEYWFSGFTNQQTFSILFIHRDGKDGAYLYGYYE